MAQTSEKTPAQELSDIFLALNYQVKVLEELMQSFDDGSRGQDDFQDRFHGQSILFVKTLSQVKPLANALLSNGWVRFDPCQFINDNSKTNVD